MKSQVNLHFCCGITADFQWIISTHCCWTDSRQDYYSEDGQNVNSIIFRKLLESHSSRFISEYCARVELKTESSLSVLQIFTFAHGAALPTVLAINTVQCCCQRCCSLISSVYFWLNSNRVRLWPSPCKVSPFWEWIYFYLVLWAAPYVKMARSQRRHIFPLNPDYISPLSVFVRGGTSAWLQITARCEGWAKWESLMNCLNH